MSSRTDPGTGEADASERHATRNAASFVTSAGTGADILESSGLYGLLVESVQDYAIFALDPAGYILSWNEGAQRIKGYRAEEIIGRHFSIFYPQEDIEAGKTELELRVAAKEGRFEDEGWRIRKDGSRFWANVVITALRDSNGGLAGFAKVTRDLTERRKAEEKAIGDAQRIAAAEAASRAKSEFLAILSHELRTPLNAIGGYAELLDLEVGGPLTSQQREYLRRLQTSQQHLLGVINDLLNYSRVEAGQVAFEIEDVQLHPLIDRVLVMVTPQANAKRLKIVHGPCGGDVTGRADDAKVEQIVLNLITNAVKFTPEGGEVSASCEWSGDQALIRISDTGPGIPREKWESIFEPFVQLGRGLSHHVEGAGLGLAISRDLSRGLGGELSVESTPGEGSTFTLALPAGESGGGN